MRADLIERLRWNAKMSRGDHRHITADLLAEAADALASQEPVAWQVTDAMVEVANRAYWNNKDGMRAALEAALASPVVPVAAKAEAVDAAAARMWKAEAEQSGTPASVAAARTREAFDEQAEELKARWRKFARAALGGSNDQ